MALGYSYFGNKNAGKLADLLKSYGIMFAIFNYVIEDFDSMMPLVRVGVKRANIDRLFK